jgi:hypothetical protein
MLKKGLISLGLLVVAAIVFVYTRPDTYRVERSAEIHAPADVVFALIDDLQQWPRWSPWEKLDPDLKKSYEGPRSGPGATYAWSGNAEVGEGRITIVESKPGELVRVELRYFKPFQGTSEARFELAPSEAGTRVRWSVEGENGFAAKAISLLMDVNALIGASFEQGLADLDAAARAEVLTSS